MRDTAHEANESGKAGGVVDAVVRRECDVPQVGALMHCRASSRSAAPRCRWLSGGGRGADQDLSYRIESQVWMAHPLGNASPGSELSIVARTITASARQPHGGVAIGSPERGRDLAIPIVQSPPPLRASLQPLPPQAPANESRPRPCHLSRDQLVGYE